MHAVCYFNEEKIKLYYTIRWISLPETNLVGMNTEKGRKGPTLTMTEKDVITYYLLESRQNVAELAKNTNQQAGSCWVKWLHYLATSSVQLQGFWTFVFLCSIRTVIFCKVSQGSKKQMDRETYRLTNRQTWRQLEMSKTIGGCMDIFRHF